MLVSVVIATKDRPTFLPQAVASIAAQTIASLELVIVNDGGSVPDITDCGAPVRVVDLAIGVGQPAALNVGVRLARGDNIALCDDDDLYAPHHLERLLAGCGAAALAYTTVHAFVDGPGDVTATLRRPFRLAELRETNYIVPSSILFKRDTYDRSGGFDEGLRHYWDWDFFLKAADCGDLTHIDEPLTYYRVHAASEQLRAAPAERRVQLDALCDRHGLGSLPLRNLIDNFAPRPDLLGSCE